jgi:enoyl-CoA hydratase
MNDRPGLAEWGRRQFTGSTVVGRGDAVIETMQLDGATLVRLKRPPVNAFDTELNEAVAAVFGDLDGPVVVTGTGRCFSAGVDLRAVLAHDSAYTERFLRSLVASFLAVFDHPGPVIAAVNGHALAGGCVLAMAADERYMSAGTIGITEVAVGVPFPVSAIEICRHVMGASLTTASLSGEAVTATDALRLQWIDAIVPAEQLLDVAAARARRLGALSPDVYAFTKRQLHRPARTAIDDGAAEDERVSADWCSAETRARMATFLAGLG